MRVRASALLLGLLLASAVGCSGDGSKPEAAGHPEFLLGGIQVNEPDPERWVAVLGDSGFNTVAVTVYARQGEWDSSDLSFDDQAPRVVEEIRAARRSGMGVVLVLRVALDETIERNRFLWHGMIMPRSDAQLAEWFRRYGRFVSQWARISEAEGVSVLAVASELNALTNAVPIDELPALEEYWTNDQKIERERARVIAHAGEGEIGTRLDEKNRAHAEWARQTTWFGAEDALERINRRRALLDGHWRELIAQAGGDFSGPLSYAANFDQYTFVPFWDALDLISINAYFPLRERLLPDSDSDSDQLGRVLEAGWRGHLLELEAFRRSRGVPDHRVLFTEIGYTSRVNSTIQPWAHEGFAVLPDAEGTRLIEWQKQPSDPAERALAMRGLYQAHRQMGGDLLSGLLYWKLSSVASHVEIEPFVLVIGERAPPDPLLDELRRFAAD